MKVSWAYLALDTVSRVGTSTLTPTLYPGSIGLGARPYLLIYYRVRTFSSAVCLAVLLG